MTETRNTIFITGAGKGIGESTARLFASKGWFLGLTDVDENSVNVVADSIGRDKCWVRQLDVRDYDAFDAVAREFGEATGGRVDVLFNNAGLLKVEKFENVTREMNDLLIDVNIKGVIHGINAFLDMLKQTPNSHIVSMCSASAIYGVPYFAVYSATKFAVRALTEALNIEFANFGITVSDVMPPFVATDMLLGQEWRPKGVEFMGIKVGPDEVAKWVWKAANGRRVHYCIKPEQRLYKALSGVEHVGRPVMKFNMDR